MIDIFFGGKKITISSALPTQEVYTEDRLGQSLSPVFNRWSSEAPGVYFCMSKTNQLLVIVTDLEEEDHWSITLMDAIKLDNLNLGTDPRVIPARIGNRSFSSKRNPEWDILLLLCIFDMLNKEDEIIEGKYWLWETLEVSIEVEPESSLVYVSDIYGPKVRFEEDARI